MDSLIDMFKSFLNVLPRLSIGHTSAVCLTIVVIALIFFGYKYMSRSAELKHPEKGATTSTINIDKVDHSQLDINQINVNR